MDPIIWAEILESSKLEEQDKDKKEETVNNNLLEMLPYKLLPFS
jgi:hypothetical protein